MKNKTLITGSTGFIGSHIANYFERKGHQLLKGTKNRNIINEKNYTYLNLSDISSIERVFSENKIGAVIHFGAKIGFNNNLAELQKENVTATKVIVENALNHNAFFVFASGTIVYSSDEEYINEFTIPNPSNPYGESKLLGEKYIIQSGVRYCIHRIGGVFGYNGPNHLSLNKSIIKAIKGERLSLHGNNFLKRNYIYVKDVAKVVYKSVVDQIEGIHILAGEEIKTFEEMIIDISSTLTPNISPEIKQGKNTSNSQVYKCSKLLTEQTRFIEAIEDIKNDHLKS